MNPLKWNFRAQMFAGALACAALLAYAIFMQLKMGLEPCPFCIYQRLAFAALGLIFLLGTLHGPRQRAGRITYSVLAVIPSAIGALVAGRHVWLQTRPADVLSSCGPPLSFLSETMGPLEVFRTVLTGTSNCGDIDWVFLGLTMPMWCLVWFGLLAVWVMVAGLRAETVA